MRKFKRIIHKQFGGLGNVLMIIVLVAVTVIFINTYVLTRPSRTEKETEENRPIDIITSKPNQTILTSKLISNHEEKPIVKQQSTPDPGCEIDETCSDGSIPYKVISGDGIEKYPVICFNNKLLIHHNLKDTKIGRGVNLVAFDGKTFEHKLTETFDTYLEESFFSRTLKLSLNDGDIIILASFDEMTYGLKEASHTIMEKYGSQLIKIIKFRDSFVMIGQKGLARGKAIEMHQPKGNRDFAPAAHISGCAKFPLGAITPLSISTPEVNKDGKIAVGNSVRHCGLPEPCSENEFAVHVYTGKDNNDEPKICVDGRYVIAKGINDAGRGLNIVIVSNGKEVIRTGHFDTWQEDSTNLEIFLENLEDNVIMIAVTFDEAATKLSEHCKNLFSDLGSAVIQNVKYRDNWVLITRKGIQGFTPYEEISHAGSGNTYAPPIDKRFCVPQTLKGIKIRPDPLPFRNDKRRDFCSRYDGYGDFCNDANVDRSLLPVPVVNKTLENNPIYSTPILVIAGISHNSLRMCLETILMQPGLRAENVIVTVDEKFSDPLALIDLFGFRAEKISSSSNYMEHYEKSLKKLTELYPANGSMIVIEEDLILSPDFLYTLALLYETYTTDDSIAGIQMWNPNSYEDVDGSVELIYRVDTFHGLGYLIRKAFFDKYMKDSFSSCCSKRVWDKWKFSEPSIFLMPDVSRVFRRPLDGNRLNNKYLDDMFNRKRRTSLTPFPAFSDLDKLTKDNYYKYFAESIRSATLLTSLEKCETFHQALHEKIKDQANSNSFKYIYDQDTPDDFKLLKPVLPCFGLFSQEPLGLYQGILTFSSKRHRFFLIGKKSPFYTTFIEKASA